MSIPFSPPLALKTMAPSARPHRFQYDFTSTPILNSDTPKHENHTRSIKRSIAYTIPLNYGQFATSATLDTPNEITEKLVQEHANTGIYSSANKCGHILGVTSLATCDKSPAFDLLANYQNSIDSSDFSQILYTGGRDGTVKLWSLEHNSKDLGNPTQTTRKTRQLASSAHHNDWVNSIVSINEGKTVVSGSSDLSIRAWTPFSEEGSKIETIGSHSDYVKALTYCHDHSKILSGGLDSVIKVWDVNAAGKNTVSHKLDKGIKTTHSIYSLSCNSDASIIATATTDKTLWLYDLRSKGHTGWLNGHTDFVTSVLVSKNGDYLLSGSSDTTVKLWSLKSRKCILTFSCHDSSVWSLFSNDPALNTFYSGDKDGCLIKTKHKSQAASDVSVLIGKESNSVVEILAERDEQHLWTATFGLGFNCWKNVDDDYFEKDNDCAENGFCTNGSDSEPVRKLAVIADSVTLEPLSKAVHSAPIESIVGPAGLRKHIVLQNKRHVLAINTDNEISLWDLISAKCIKIFEKEWGSDLDSIAGALNNPVQNLPSWCSVDTKIGLLTVKMEMNQVWDTEAYVDQLDSLTSQERIYLLNNGCERLNMGPWVMKNLLKNLNLLEFLVDNNVQEFANPVSNWVTSTPDGDILSLKTIISEHSKEDMLDLATVQHVEIVERPVELPPPTTEKSKSVGLFRSNTSGGQDSQKSSPKGMSKLFSWKSKKNKVEKKAASEVPVSEPSLSKTLGEASNADLNSVASDPSSSNGKVKPKLYSQCSEVEKNLICILETNAHKDKRAKSKLIHYPTNELPSQVKLLVFEEGSNGSVPYCIYSSTIADAKAENTSYSRHNVSGDPRLTLGISLPSWVVEHFVCTKFPASYKPSPHLQFNLRPHASIYLQLRSLGSDHTNLSAHQMLRASKLSLYVSEHLRLQLPPHLYVDSLVETLRQSQTTNTKSHENTAANNDRNAAPNARAVKKTTQETRNAGRQKCILELALEELGEKPGVEERVALHTLCKLPDFQVPEKLKPILSELAIKYQAPKEFSTSMKSQATNSTISKTSENTTSASGKTHSLGSQHTSQAEESHPGSRLETENAKTQKSHSELNTQIPDTAATNCRKSVNPQTPNSSDSSDNAHQSASLLASRLDQNNTQNINSLSFIWIDVLCKGKRLDPLTTLGTIRSSIWKSSQEIEITYKWKSFVIDRIGDRPL